MQTLLAQVQLLEQSSAMFTPHLPHYTYQRYQLRVWRPKCLIPTLHPARDLFSRYVYGTPPEERPPPPKFKPRQKSRSSHCTVPLFFSLPFLSVFFLFLHRCFLIVFVCKLETLCYETEKYANDLAAKKKQTGLWTFDGKG